MVLVGKGICNAEDEGECYVLVPERGSPESKGAVGQNGQDEVLHYMGCFTQVEINAIYDLWGETLSKARENSPKNAAHGRAGVLGGPRIRRQAEN